MTGNGGSLAGHPHTRGCTGRPSVVPRRAEPAHHLPRQRQMADCNSRGPSRSRCRPKPTGSATATAA
eukprot:scaffold83958_cov51-Phaeocystis_antarctica.AAC.3